MRHSTLQRFGPARLVGFQHQCLAAYRRLHVLDTIPAATAFIASFTRKASTQVVAELLIGLDGRTSPFTADDNALLDRALRNEHLILRNVFHPFMRANLTSPAIDTGTEKPPAQEVASEKWPSCFP